MNTDIKKYCITPDKTLLECMQITDSAGTGIAVAVDESFRLIGTISDGDIRRALINGHDIETPIAPHINKRCFRVTSAESRNEVLDIMQARWLEQVPIVDKNDKVVGLHLLHDILGRTQRPNWAVIMAGGKGMRLRPLTENLPKPMIKVAGRPILERLILQFVTHGITNIYLAVNYLAHVIEDHFEDGTRYGCKIEYLRENKPLGSGGALSLLPDTPTHPTVLINGDLIVDVNFSHMLDFHCQNKFYTTMGVHPYYHQVPYGCIDEVNKQIVSIEEKPVIQKTINAGVYVLSPEAVASIPTNTFFPITELIENALEASRPCGTFSINREWVDIGSPKELEKATGVFR